MFQTLTRAPRARDLRIMCVRCAGFRFSNGNKWTDNSAPSRAQSSNKSGSKSWTYPTTITKSKQRQGGPRNSGKFNLWKICDFMFLIARRAFCVGEPRIWRVCASVRPFVLVLVLVVLVLRWSLLNLSDFAKKEQNLEEFGEIWEFWRYFKNML